MPQCRPILKGLSFPNPTANQIMCVNLKLTCTWKKWVIKLGYIMLYTTYVVLPNLLCIIYFVLPNILYITYVVLPNILYIIYVVLPKYYILYNMLYYPIYWGLSPSIEWETQQPTIRFCDIPHCSTASRIFHASMRISLRGGEATKSRMRTGLVLRFEIRIIRIVT